jgi:hypothetical protein
MNTGVHENCRRSACTNSIPPMLSREQLCLQHFLDESFRRTDDISRQYQEKRAIGAADLEWMLEDALLIVTSLEADSPDLDEGQRERMLELLLNLANLHEFAAQPSHRPDPA